MYANKSNIMSLSEFFYFYLLFLLYSSDFFFIYILSFIVWPFSWRKSSDPCLSRKWWFFVTLRKAS